MKLVREKNKNGQTKNLIVYNFRYNGNMIQDRLK